MPKGVFTTKPESRYDDLPEIRYHFPKRYLQRVERTVGDWIVYYEPRRVTTEEGSRGGRQAYFATARVVRIVPDPLRDDHHYAVVEHFLEFPRSVPFRDGRSYYESGLARADGETNRGAFGNAVRLLTEQEYEAILAAGLGDAAREDDEVREGSDARSAAFERPIEPRLVMRPFRDRAFAATILHAYDSTCCLSGFRMLDARGSAEVEAAHVRPVSSQGPDSPRNGLALCRSAHWMFDHGLISIEADGRILVAEGRVPARVRTSLLTEPYARMPRDPALRPHPEYLRFHREVIFAR